jgi:integrase
MIPPSREALLDTAHLKKRRQTWYARHTVPPSLQGVLGRSEFVRTLKTRDLREANQRKHAVLAQMQREITQAAFTATLPRDSAEYLLRAAARQRRAVQQGRLTESAAETRLDALVARHLRSLRPEAKANGPDRAQVLPEARERALKLAHRVLHGEEIAPLRKMISTYLTEIQTHIRKQTYREKERHLGALADWLKTDCEVTAVSKRVAGRYVTEALTQAGHAPKTVKDTLSNLSAFWAWLEGRGFVEENPWRGMFKTVKTPMRGVAKTRRAWTNAELLQLLQSVSPTDPLFALAALAIYSGLRREEISQLRVEDVENEALIVREGKSPSALRAVPVHPVIGSLIDRLRAHSRDGYLLSGLLPGGADAKRGHYLGKRFGGLIRKAGFTDPSLVFHTLRHSFIQRCEEGGVPESSAKLLVGHSRRSSLTYGNAGVSYSPGVSLETLRQEIAKVSFGELDEFVRTVGAQVKITRVSRPRALAGQVG